MEGKELDEGSDMRAETDRSFEEAEAQGLEMFLVPRGDMVDVVFMKPLTDEQRVILEPALNQAVWDANSRLQVREQRQNAARKPRKSRRNPHLEMATRIAQGYLSRRPNRSLSWAANRALSDEAFAGLDADELPSSETVRKELRKIVGT